MCTASDSIQTALERLAAAQRAAIVVEDGASKWIAYIGRLRDALDDGKNEVGDLVPGVRRVLSPSDIVGAANAVELAAEGLADLDPAYLPVQPANAAAAVVSALTFDPLFRLTANETVEPILGTGRLEGDDVVVGLRAVRWHDDAALTSDDVVTSWNAFTAKGAATVPFGADVVGRIVADKVSPTSVVFRTQRRGRAALRILSEMPIVPTHSARTLTGTGPFRLSQIDSERIELLANDRYVLGKPDIDTIVLSNARRMSTSALTSAAKSIIANAVPNLHLEPTADLVFARTMSQRSQRTDSLFLAGTPASPLARRILIAASPETAAMQRLPAGLRCDGRKERHRYPDPGAEAGDPCECCADLGDEGRVIAWEW